MAIGMTSNLFCTSINNRTELCTMVFQRRRNRMGFVRSKRIVNPIHSRRNAPKPKVVRKIQTPQQLRRVKITPAPRRTVRRVKVVSVPRPTPHAVRPARVARVARVAPRPTPPKPNPTIPPNTVQKLPVRRKVTRSTPHAVRPARVARVAPRPTPPKPNPTIPPNTVQKLPVRRKVTRTRTLHIARANRTHSQELKKLHTAIPATPVQLPPIESLEAYCINLDRRADRWKAIQASWMKHVGPLKNLHRVAAVDTGDLKGCGLSHQKIIRQAKAEGKPFVLVMEGDALFYPTFQQTYKEMRRTLQKQTPLVPWDIVLGGVHFFSGKNKIYPPNLIAVGDFSATHCVLYRNTCYDVVLGWKPEMRHIDRFLGRTIRHKLATTPFLSYTSNGFSEIRRRNVNDMTLYDKNQANMRRIMSGQGRSQTRTRRH